jgi:hypothetical protein
VMVATLSSVRPMDNVGDKRECVGESREDKRDREDGGDHAPLDELGIETRGEPVTAGTQ